MHHGPKDDLDLDLDLSSAALVFRLLRGHGIPAAPTDMLSAFFGGGNNQKAAKDDMDGLLALYEASYLAFPGEAAVLDEARAFAVENLQRRQQAPSFMDALPLQWTAPRLRAMWSLRADYCCDDKRIDPAIVQLAKADFNLVQAVHRGELVKIIKWWKESGLGEKLAFARDRVVESFFCAACIAPEPHLGECREVLAKTSAIIVHLDDIYDLYGTPDELEAFTDAIGRWDNVSAAAAAGALPEYMKAMYSAIWKTSVTAADRVLHKHGYHVLPLYKKAWHDLCKAFLVEAQWQHQGYRPSFDEYLTNGWVTSTGPLLLLHALPTITQQPAEIMSMLQVPWNSSGSGSGSGSGAIEYPRLVELSSRIFRLCNDCASHQAESERGDAPSSIACCMTEMCASEQQARAAVQDAIADTWKELNEEVVVAAAAAGQWNPCSAESMANLCLNLARIIHCIYQDGDGITSPTHRTKQLIKDVLFNPI
ncbi:alpha-terpineol synthase, chloroplastic-like [Phragmites australis]|uniref:alpha-terpineol synthase, chloroplastic-like n=1 Tax=Phragmites australis TaxID=29695 RepID=UPI002D77C9CE|nr:alpha-terpineol synthase, chloroplastic-like [Phragmites australis]